MSLLTFSLLDVVNKGEIARNHPKGFCTVYLLGKDHVPGNDEPAIVTLNGDHAESKDYFIFELAYLAYKDSDRQTT